MEPANTEINYLEIIKRRKWSFTIPCLAVITIALVVSLYLPSVYRSTAKILVKSPEISSYYVRQSVTGYAAERVRTIKSKVFNSDSILEFVQSEGVYPSSNEELDESHLIQLVRQNTKIEKTKIDADFAGNNTIAFAISYEDNDPNVAMKYAQYLTNKFLEENASIRKKQANEVTDFLEREMSKLEDELRKIENKIEDFKEEHINELPSLLQQNMNRLQGVKSKKEGLQEKLLNVKDLQRDLQIRLATIPENKEELTERSKLVQLENKVADLKRQYSKEYPDVILAEAELLELREKMSRNPSSDSGKEKIFVNPDHLAMSSQLSTIRNEIKSVQRQIEELILKEEELQARIETTLRIEDDYNYLISQRTHTQKKHDELVQKLMDATISKGLEEEEKGERLTLIQQPNYPRKPYKPNRLAIAVLGFFIAVSFGTGVVTLQEYFDHSIKNIEGLEELSLGPVIGFVPLLYPEKHVLRKNMMRRFLLFVLIVILFSGVFMIYKSNNLIINNLFFEFVNKVKVFL